MKKILVLCLLMILSISFVFEAYADGNTDSKTSKFTVTVVLPLGMESAGTGIMDLGFLAPGQTKHLGADKALIFTITGEPGFEYSLTNPLAETSAQSGKVSLTGITWQVQTSNDWSDATAITSFPYNGNLNSTTGKAFVRVYPETVSAAADAASESDLEFQFTLTCSYVYL